MSRIEWFFQEDWPFPKKTPGNYLAWIALEHSKELRLVTIRVEKISNGVLAVMDGHFMNDYMGPKDKIVTWAHAGPPPNWRPE